MRIQLIDVAAKPSSKQSFQTMTLPRVAGCTPLGIDVTITDGRVEVIELDDTADLIGMTFSCNMSPYAYELADRARAKGLTVVAGGVHTTAMPQEALQHFDAVLTGEAEGGAWERLIADCQAGKMKGIYTNGGPPSLDGLRPPRLDLLRYPERYLDFAPMEATRGCLHNCSFCFNSSIHGLGLRTRPVEEVVEDVRRSKHKRLMFMDDNLCGNKAYAKRLFKALIPLKKHLFYQTSLLMAEDEELLELAEKAGTQFVFVGIESFEQASLKDVQKQWNKIDNYKRYLDAFHRHSIFVSGGLILGLDSDKKDIFDKTLHYLNEIGLDNAAVNLLIPYPGTSTYDEMKAEGRLMTDDYTKYTGFDLVVCPKNMTPEELLEGYDHVLKEFFKARRYVRTMRRNQMTHRAHVYALAWWREPRRRTLLSLGKTLNRRGGDFTPDSASM